MTRVPTSVDQAVESLNGLAALITASEWQRAAIVWAFTEEGKPGPGVRTTSSAISIREFGRLGVSGLKSQDTVRKFRKAWAQAIADGHATDIGPGDLVDLPEVDWGYWDTPEAEDQDESEEVGDQDGDTAEPMNSTLRIKFFKDVARMNAVTRYQPEDIIELLGDDETDYVHIEQQVQILASWLNAITLKREGGDDRPGLERPKFHCDGDDGFDKGMKTLGDYLHNLTLGVTTVERQRRMVRKLERVLAEVRRWEPAALKS